MMLPRKQWRVVGDRNSGAAPSAVEAMRGAQDGEWGALNTMRATSKKPPSSAFRRHAPGSGPDHREERDDHDGDECSHRMLESVSTPPFDGKRSSAM